MNMGAYFLARLGGTKYPDDGDPGCRLLLSGCIVAGYFRIKLCGFCLIVVDAIKSDAKSVHRSCVKARLIEQRELESMVGKMNERQYWTTGGLGAQRGRRLVRNGPLLRYMRLCGLTP